VNVGKYRNRHPHISEMRVRVNERLHPNMTKEQLSDIVADVLDGLPAPEGIEVKSFYYGQSHPSRDGKDMLEDGKFQFISPARGFNVSIKRKVKK
jgi:hypothetical protein